jgi:hypothetical protein
MTSTMLFTGEETVTGLIAEYEGRLHAVRERIDAYHPDCSRRYATDEYHVTCDRIRGARNFLSGEYDSTYAGPHASFGSTLLDFRVHYALDSLRAALHDLLWAEHYAGLRSRESARELDPWNN